MITNETVYSMICYLNETKQMVFMKDINMQIAFLVSEDLSF
jgi:hypothetical protein